jgi:hypothetical protein
MNASEDRAQARPDIVENYKDFDPPANVRQIVEELVDAVPQKYLNGLKTILLTNLSALSRNQRRQKMWSRNRKIGVEQARGSYARATKSSSAMVRIYVDNALESWPPWTLRMPLMRYQVLADVLYHEIGHHIHAVHKPEYEGPENVAEAWERRLTADFVKARYWYLVPALRIAGKLIRLWERCRKRLRRMRK